MVCPKCRKELREYERSCPYPGIRWALEHFWIEAVKGRTDAEYLDAREIPASLVTELATDPNGAVLQAANGRPAQLYVIVPVDGTLRISFGAGADLGCILPTPNAPEQRVFSRCAAPFFLEIRQYSCEKMSCSTQKSLAAGHIGSWKNTP